MPVADELVAAPSPPVSAEEALYEVVDGQRVELPPMGARETHLATILVSFLAPFARTQRLGRVEGEMLFLLDAPTHLERRPDVAFVSYDRWSRAQRVPTLSAWPVVPNLAVEVVSPTNTAPEVLRKVREYFRFGAQLVWVIYPDEEQVYVYSSPTSIQVIELAGELDGAALLPGFRLPLTDLFEHEDAPGPQP